MENYDVFPGTIRDANLILETLLCALNPEYLSGYPRLDGDDFPRRYNIVFAFFGNISSLKNH